MKIKVAYDYKLFILQRYGGISRYLYSLVKQLSKSQEIYPKIFSPLHNNYYITQLKKINYFGIYAPLLFPKLTRPSETINTFVSLSKIKKFQPNIVHETYYSTEHFLKSNVPRVLTVHDLINEIYPQQFMNNNSNISSKSNSIKRADHIICVSKNTQRDLLEHYQIPKEKTTVVYHGVDDIFINKNCPITRQLNKPFLLYVGSRSKYKNFKKLLLAYSLSKHINKEFNLICFGGGNFTNCELNMIKETGLNLSQVHYKNGDDKLLSKLYRNATLFVYPSLYEGFGIPLLEAMASGCPVICSNSSSIPEVVGNAAQMFNPEQEEDIKYNLEKVLFSEKKLKSMKSKGFNNSKKFSWENCAKKTSQVYKSLL